MIRCNPLFWKQYPALLLAISFLLGSSGYLWSLPFFFPLVWLIYLAILGKPFFLRGVCLFTLAWLYCWALYKEAPHPKDPQRIEGIFSIESVQPYRSPFQKGFLYKGSLALPQAISCSFCLYGEERMQAQDYWVEGLLSERSPFHYTLKLKSHKKLSSRLTLAELRYRAKEAFRKFLAKRTSPATTSLLHSLTTGDVEERELRYLFNRAGLQHILSISGFHFALLLFFFSALLALFCAGNIKNWLLLFLITLYFLFVGPAPAVTRSFCTASFFLIGKLLQRRPSALNLLGCAMLFELVQDPLASGSIGFQLSFLSCFSLIEFYPKMNALLQLCLPFRDRKIVSQMTKPSIFGYFVSSFLRKTLAVTCAVNLALLPILLYQFHKFPLLAILYNLFIPLGMSLSMFLLFTSLLLYPISQWILAIADRWTLLLLDLISYPPLFLERSLFCSCLPVEICLSHLFILFFISINKKN